MRMYVYAIIIDGVYDLDLTFDDPEEAIRAAMHGEQVAVLDSLSLEYYGCIE